MSATTPMTRRSRTPRLLAVVVVLLALALSGCGVFDRGAADLDLPGGADLGDHPYTLKADFSDVLDLVPQSSVQVDDVPVGRVESITLSEDGESARVTMSVNGSVVLPRGTTARIQQTTLLGEKYVALLRPGGPAGTVLASAATGSTGSTASGRLGDGDVVPLSSTSQAVGVEQVLGALSMLLNGGGVGQFQEISRELQAISTGRTDQIRGFLRQTRAFVSTLDAHRDDITGALDGLDRLGRQLERDQGKVVTALEDVQPGLAVLDEQRGQLVAMLKALDRLSTVTTRTLDRSREDIVADLELLSPILDQLGRSGSDLPQALQVLLTYPFPDAVLPAIRGDYLNTFIRTAYQTPGGPWAQESLWPTINTFGARTALTDGGPPPLMLPSTEATSGPTPSGSASPSSPSTPSGSPSSPSGPSGSPSPSDAGSPSGSPSGDASSSPSPQSPQSPQSPAGSPSDAAGDSCSGEGGSAC